MSEFWTYRIENRGAGQCVVFSDEFHQRDVMFNGPSLECRIANLERLGHDAGIERLALAELTGATPQPAMTISHSICMQDWKTDTPELDKCQCRDLPVPSTRSRLLPSGCAIAVFEHEVAKLASCFDRNSAGSASRST